VRNGEQGVDLATLLGLFGGGIKMDFCKKKYSKMLVCLQRHKKEESRSFPLFFVM
jgi:hypothetical protein